MHQRVVVFDAALQQQFVGDRAEFPPRGNIAGGAFAGQLGNQFQRAVEHGGFLLAGHRNRVFVAVAVHANFVAAAGDFFHLFGEGFDGVAGDKPSGFQLVFVE